jgi:putative transposase
MRRGGGRKQVFEVIMLQAIESLQGQIGLRASCDALGFSRATWQRRAKPAVAKLNRRRLTSSPIKLDPEARERFLKLAHSAEFVDKAPPQIYFALLDLGAYICSVRTMYRILAAEHEVNERRNQLRHPNYKRPELLATGPNQLWSWDITKLRGPVKGLYYHLYVVLDVFSRYVVGWRLATHESDELAQQLILASCEKQGISPGQLTLHADNGASMISSGVAGLLERLDVRKSHSRPGISDDNPYSESQFKTLKYRPEYPDRFGSYEDALSYCRHFFPWYLNENYHSGICWLTPASVHYGQAESILDARHATLTAVYNLYPERFRNGPPKRYKLPEAVWINPPYRRVPEEVNH